MPSTYGDRSPMTQALLKERLTYDPATGVFTWLKNYARVKVGDRAGTLDDRGYRQIVINQKFHYAHQLAWLFMTGIYPGFEIDHEDLDKDNNRWKNLRPATRSQNNANTASTNPLGKGVRREGKKFRAQIRVSGKSYRSELFETSAQAADAYKAMAERNYGEYARY